MIRWHSQSTEFVPRRLPELLERLPDGLAKQVRQRLSVAPLVLLAPAVRTQVEQHVAASESERGGLLLGAVYAADGAGAPSTNLAVHVGAAVASLDYVASGVALRMASSVWDLARPWLDDGCLVVGWYHSHPGLGAFFSATDHKTQRAFFAHAYSLGWVIDPVRREEKWFLGAAAREVAANGVLCV